MNGCSVSYIDSLNSYAERYVANIAYAGACA
jgi:hypothetical protein